MYLRRQVVEFSDSRVCAGGLPLPGCTNPDMQPTAPAPLPSLQFTHAYFMVWIFLGDWPDRIRLTVTRHFFSIFFSRKAETRFMRGAAAYMGWLARLTSRGTVRLSVVYLSPNGI